MKIAENEDSITVYLTGDIDHHSARGIRADTDAVVQMKKPSVLNLDFSGVNFMDSSGIGLIMGRSKLIKECGGRLEVLNPQPYIRRVLKLAGIERIVKIR